jgi:hypothetical protein
MAVLVGVGRTDLAGLGPASVCFGEAPGTLRPGPWAVLPRQAGDDEAAARLAHLAHHARHGRGLVAGQAPVGACAEAVDEALEEEAAAHVLEMEVQRVLGVRSTFANADEVLALPPEARSAAVLAYLRAHPEGGDGYAPLGRDYAERCARATRP